MNQPNHRRRKLLALAVIAGLALCLSGCYMEPDRVVDDTNGLTIGTGGQNFDPVVTPEAIVTATPTPTGTADQSVDWSSWDFGNDTATDPPSNVINIGATATPNVPGQVGGTSATATPTPAATTATSDTLKSGSTGAAVKQLQQRLKELGYYTGSVDGSYGAGTTNAVKAFQSANNLTADGIAGKKTQEAIYSYYAIAKKDAPATSATARPSTGGSSGSSGGSSTGTITTTTTSSYTNGKTDIYLQLGSSGAQVKILQNRLIVLGYISGTADGDYGETTEAAVTAFQKRNSIYADGIAGPTTLSKLYSSSAKKASSVVSNLGSLKAGMSGGGVRALQTQLKSLGYYTGSVDGDFGDGTTAAVIAFQSDHGLKADGIAGKATMNAIYSATGTGGSGGSGGSSTSGGSAPATYGKTASTNGYKTIASDTKSPSANVTALQSALSSQNYYSGSLDGSFGSGTAAAVEAFQSARGLRVTGMAGPSTQRLLYGYTSESGSYSKLQVGSKGSAVRDLQYTLYELKYYDGNITGTYDEATENAVMLFQQVNGLSIDGVAGEATQRRLYSSNAIPCNI